MKNIVIEIIPANKTLKETGFTAVCSDLGIYTEGENLGEAIQNVVINIPESITAEQEWKTKKITPCTNASSYSISAVNMPIS